MRKWILMMAGLIALGTSGCIDNTKTIMLNEDGSGYIVDETYLSAAAMQMMGGVMAGMQGPGSESGVQTAKKNPMLDEDDAKAKASEFGSGVVFNSIKEVKKADGSAGARVVYKFDDINKIKLDMNQKQKGGPGMKMADSSDSAENKNPITFSYTKGNLTINMPKHEKPDMPDAPPAEDMDDAMSEAMGAQMMQGMAPMLKGMRMRVLLKTPSQIKKTNASHVAADPKSKQKVYLTLLDFSMDKLLEQPDGMQKMTAMQKIQDPAEKLELLKDITGVKVEMNEKVNVQF